MRQDEDYQNAKANFDRQNAKITHDKTVEDKFQDIIYERTELYRRFTDNPEFRDWLCDTLFDLDYEGPEKNAS